MKPTRKLYLMILDYFHGYHSTIQEDNETTNSLKRMIEECFGKGACDI